jgi:flagellar motor switch protein FliM
VLEERHVTLGEVTELKVGQVLKLQATPKSRVKLESQDQPLFWCQLGQSEGTYKLRIEDVFDHEQEFYNDVLSR